MARTLKEILEEAKELGGRYVFNELSEEDAKVLESHDVKYNVLYPVGSRKTVDTAVNQDTAQDFSQLRPDLKKSYDFWNSLNKTESEKPGAAALNYQLTNLDNKALLVEAKRENKTVFKGVDHGRKGFDVVKTAELPSCEQLDRVVKRAKFLNPKTVIRIKDNVTDPVLRNKMLIACALNNVKPVGNLPEDFNFAALRDFVKQTEAKDYDALAEILYTPQENEFNLGSELSVADTRRDRAANIVYRETPVERRETRPEYRTAADREENKERRDAPVVPVVVNPGRNNGGNNDGNGNDRNNTVSSNVQTGTGIKKESWGRRAWRKAKHWIVGGVVVLATIWGYKSCEKKNADKNIAPVEVVAKPKINSLADLRNHSTLDYLLNDWNKDGYISVEDFQGVDWNNDGRIDSRDNELAHKIYAIVEKYRKAKNCADDKLLDSIEKEMDALVKKNCGEEKKVVKKTTIRKQTKPKVIRDTVYVKGDTVYLKPDTVYLKPDTRVVRDTVYIQKQEPPVEEQKQDDELLSGRRKNKRDVETSRVLNENQTRTVETEEKKEDLSTAKGRTLTPREINKMKKEHTK